MWLGLVVERLRIDGAEIGCIGAFQLDHRQRLAIFQDRTIGLLAALLVLELSSELKARLRIQRVAQDVHEQIAQKTFLVLFLLALADVILDIRVVEMQLERFVKSGHAHCVLLREVFGEDGLLEQRHAVAK